MVRMGDEAVLREDVGGRVGAGLDIDDLALRMADHEIGRTNPPGGKDRQQRHVVGFRVENLAAPHMERFFIGVLAVVIGDQAVFDKPDAVLVDAHFAADDARFGVAEDVGAVIPSNPQHNTAPMDPGEPVPVLTQKRVAVGRGFGQHAKG